MFCVEHDSGEREKKEEWMNGDVDRMLGRSGGFHLVSRNLFLCANLFIYG